MWFMGTSVAKCSWGIPYEYTYVYSVCCVPYCSVGLKSTLLLCRCAGNMLTRWHAWCGTLAALTSFCKGAPIISTLKYSLSSLIITGTVKSGKGSWRTHRGSSRRDNSAAFALPCVADSQGHGGAHVEGGKRWKNGFDAGRRHRRIGRVRSNCKEDSTCTRKRQRISVKYNAVHVWIGVGVDRTGGCGSCGSTCRGTQRSMLRACMRGVSTYVDLKEMCVSRECAGLACSSRNGQSPLGRVRVMSCDC